jgi:glycerol-3-phosphate dehydrogenase
MGRLGFGAGDLLRLAARTGHDALPRARHLSRIETLRAVPALRSDGLRGGLLGWDGQLEDDARLVVAIARTAAAHGARILTRCDVEELSGEGANVRDTISGKRFHVSARAVINATGVWAGTLVDGVELRPSRGTHVVVDGALFGHLGAEVTIPVPGERNRFVFALPQSGGRVYIGLTDEPVDGDIPDVPVPAESEIRFLLAVINTALHTPIRREDVRGSFAGLRPLLAGARGRTADLSRRHAVLTSSSGVVTIVGGKLTTYRRMAEEAIDATVRQRSLLAGPCRTRRLPLVGAATPEELARIAAPRRLVARYGIEALDVIAMAEGSPQLLEPIADGVDITGAELRFGLRHEGALDEDDLLDRRTRIGLVPADRERALPAVRALLAGGLAARTGTSP